MSDNETQNEDSDYLKQKDKIDFLFKVINRFDFYINSTNTKASLIIAWNGVLIGAVLLKYGDILNVFQSTAWAKATAIVFLSLVGICSLLSNLFVFGVVFPFLKPSSKDSPSKILQTESMLFFESVAAMGSNAYHQKIIDSHSAEVISDLTDQAVTLAKGLQDKMRLIRKSIFVIYFELLFILSLLLLKAIVT
jgi:hypothetical protein